MKSRHPRFILASTSPRRIELLKQLGLTIEVAPPSADETPRRGESPRALVSRLARAKAQSVAAPLEGEFIVVAADTIVVSPKGKILGKPVDMADARRMLREICGKTHTVLTGFCVIASTGGKAKPHSRICTTRVRMRALSPKQIEAYVATGEPMDKAGSYAAQGIGMSIVESVSGSYANVVGLPIAQLLQDLEKVFGVRAFSWFEA